MRLPKCKVRMTLSICSKPVIVTHLRSPTQKRSLCSSTTSCKSLNCKRASSKHSNPVGVTKHLIDRTLTDWAAADVLDVSALSDDAVQEQLTIAQDEAMKAKAEYEIRNKISHNTLVMDPVLKAVHGGDKTGFAEK
jgi:hypothetical protein